MLNNNSAAIVKIRKNPARAVEAMRGMEVSPEKWGKVYDELVEPLMNEGISWREAEEILRKFVADYLSANEERIQQSLLVHSSSWMNRMH